MKRFNLLVARLHNCGMILNTNKIVEIKSLNQKAMSIGISKEELLEQFRDAKRNRKRDETIIHCGQYEKLGFLISLSKK